MKTLVPYKFCSARSGKSRLAVAHPSVSFSQEKGGGGLREGCIRLVIRACCNVKERRWLCVCVCLPRGPHVFDVFFCKWKMKWCEGRETLHLVAALVW